MAANSHPLALPTTLSPDDLDALSEISIVLAKVRAGIQSSNGLTSGADATPSGVNTHGQQLSFKDVPGATDGLKHKVQHARAQVRALHDMDRSIEEQNREINELEGQIERQHALLQSLRQAGLNFGKDATIASDDKMQT
jgi:hypothetical protein